MYKLLGNYRSTPHPTTGFSPRYLSMGREGKTKLLQLVVEDDNFGEVSSCEEKIKQQSCDYANVKRRTQKLDYQTGDIVFVKQAKKNKLDTTFEPIPYRVTKVQGSMITAERLTDKREITRNSSFMKKIRLDSDHDADQLLDREDTESYMSDVPEDKMQAVDNNQETPTDNSNSVDLAEIQVRETDENQVRDEKQSPNEARSRYGRTYSRPNYLNEYDTN